MVLTLTKRIQVLISTDTEIGHFDDALYFTEGEYSALADNDVVNLASARALSFVDAVKNAPAPLPLTAEQIVFGIEQLNADFKRMAALLNDPAHKDEKSLDASRAKTAAVVAEINKVAK